jgi:hypothetical protein
MEALFPRGQKDFPFRQLPYQRWLSLGQGSFRRSTPAKLEADTSISSSAEDKYSWTLLSILRPR